MNMNLIKIILNTGPWILANSKSTTTIHKIVKYTWIQANTEGKAFTRFKTITECMMFSK